jgi:hypothetical protein
MTVGKVGESFVLRGTTAITGHSLQSGEGKSTSALQTF